MANLTTQMTVAGNLTRDPEVRYTQSGQPVASFTIASTPRSYDRDTKQYVDGEAIFTNCVLWGKPAENLAAAANKGTRVIAAGSLKSRTYTNKDNETKTSVELVVDEIGLSVQFARKDQPVQRREAASDEGWNSTPQDGDDVPW